ncbi:activating transcription factor 7-interacting protein 1 isoform X1 [Triplophysa dalaica]|uniref:activating transcription factor 7-interacting protein 1 isoform X1 n=1 Tax=Triplophysa dalaica TaxID=1582913 RepID=UPI0024DF7651|nr:activating transcription factor 7-interacting protein 1 isoform X1 [Triplophysa dalaica]XP_056589020.1 activating transcription factor 7-interacting protein 1 isoform X1 [Triplophysa dalaica]XP_056589029.1 activating transcription factor 7-interacting protein 1 isoform X1 [Triplophysa dalaica]XP_056589039.1 activating transcription factor 7-interacting protein 1 isoform X1 [Triplophysa dalaica]XP_056589047.1 activating transcription factor 7-interacting protein 1 isoform X1 [Triplophysa dala
MEVAVPEEPQKKIFRARKTMKMSDRNQLESLHSTLAPPSSASYTSSTSPPLVNGTHEKEKVKENDLNHKEKDSLSPAPHSSDSSPSPFLSVSISRTPAPPNVQSTSPSPSVKNGPEKKRFEKTKDAKGENESKEDVKVDSKEACTSKHSSSLAIPAKKEDLNDGDTEKTRGEEMMDMDDALVTTASFGDGSEEKKDTCSKSISSSLSASPSSGLDCDPEVKEGFLCLSEEDDIQAEKDDKSHKSEEKMNVDMMKEQKDEKGISEKTGADNSTSVGTKRSLSEGKEENDNEIKTERDGKRARLDGEELEAQLELKITANGGSRHKLEKMVQQLVEERLRVLQLTVFDRSIKELKEKVEKIDSANKQQNALQHINTLQAKIARLAKKFGAANQASENSKRTQEAYSAIAQATNAANTNQTLMQRTVKTTVDPKLSGAATAIPAQPKPLCTPTTPTSSALASSAPILQIISTTTSSTPSSTSLTGQSQPGTLLLKTGPNTGVMTTTSVTSGGQPMSIQPLLIQLPLAMANGQSGALVNAAGGVGLIPVSSLSTVNNLNKAKTTTPATTFILQKASGTLASSCSVLSTLSTPVMSLARAVYPGGTGTVSSPNTGISVTSARTPIQCAAVVGVSTAVSSPGTTGPAATGSAAAAAGPPPASALASKTDNQASTKTTSQPARPKGSVIDLTEDDDDVQVTGVQKATISPITTQRASSLASSTPNAGVRTAQRTSVDSPSLSRPSSSTSLPPLPLAPSPPARLPPEAAHTSPPQQPQLKLARVQSQNGIVLSWCVAETDRNCAAVDTYHLYAYHQDNQGAAASSGTSAQSLWKKIGEVKALPLPMACTLTQFVSGSTYYFAVRAKDVYGRFGPFCEPQCTDVINPASS